MEKNDKSKDVCNFYISQLQIRIEQVFGLLVSKWRIFKKPIELMLHRVWQLIQASFPLHKFCINERDEVSNVILTRDPDTFVPNYEFAVPSAQTLLLVRMQRSFLQEAIHALPPANGIERPSYNIIRNSN